MITMKDIAKEAGVSRPTVSLVLNGRDSQIRISPETRDLVFKAAEKLGYRRNVLATSVKTGKSNIIGFVGSIYGDYVMSAIQGINNCVQDHNYLLKLMVPKLDGNNKFLINKIARQCVEQRLGGVVCRSLTEDQLEVLRSELEPNNIPVVLVDNSYSHDWCSRVISDDSTGIQLAVDHLVSLGHKKITHLTLDYTTAFISLRREGYIKGMKKHGLPVSEDSFVYAGREIYLTEKMYRNFDEYMERVQPTGIVSVADPLAMKFLQWAYRRNVKIPDEVSVVGYGNLDFSLLTSPALTTVNQFFEKMGYVAAKNLFKIIEGGASKKEIIVPVELLVRESTGKVK